MIFSVTLLEGFDRNGDFSAMDTATLNGAAL